MKWKLTICKKTNTLISYSLRIKAKCPFIPFKFMARSGVLWPRSDSEGNSSKLLQFSNSGNLGYYTALEQLKVGQMFQYTDS